MAYSKMYITFQNRMLHFDADIEYVDILLLEIKRKPLQQDAQVLFDGLNNERHPTISSYKICKRNQNLVIRHLKSTVFSSYIKDLYEEFTMYLRSLISEIYTNAKATPERLIGEHNAKYAATDILQHVQKGDITDYILDGVFQTLEHERSTVELIKKTCAKIGIEVSKDTLKKAIDYLEIRHKLVHTNGLVDDEFKKKHPELKCTYTDHNYIKLEYVSIQAAKDAVFALVKEIDSSAFSKGLLKSHTEK